MHQIRWVSHRQSISVYYHRRSHVSQKSRIALWASHFSKRWYNERNKLAKLFTAQIITVLWLVFHSSLLPSQWTKISRIFQNFFIDFSKRCGPCLLSRSVLQCLYFPQPNMVFGTTPIAEMLRDSAKFFCAPSVLVSKNPSQVGIEIISQLCSCLMSIQFTYSQVKTRVDHFFKYCENMNSFVLFIQVCGYNRARQRDKLVRLLDEFASLQDEAERVDSHLHEINSEEGDRRPYFSTWVLYHCLRAMSIYILSGLELELYSVHEYIYIFWQVNGALMPLLWWLTSDFLSTGICRISCTIGSYRHLGEPNAWPIRLKQFQPNRRNQSQIKKPWSCTVVRLFWVRLSNTCSSVIITYVVSE